MEEKLLYHYTSQEAIMNIVGENGICLRFSRYDCLNDINEMREKRQSRFNKKCVRNCWGKMNRMIKY